MRRDWIYEKVVVPVGIVAVLFACAVAGSGCRNLPVYVPTPIECPQPPAVQRPSWPINGLTGRETYGEILRAFGASLSAERGYSRQLEINLDGYRKK